MPDQEKPKEKKSPKGKKRGGESEKKKERSSKGKKKEGESEKKKKHRLKENVDDSYLIDHKDLEYEEV